MKKLLLTLGLGSAILFTSCKDEIKETDGGVKTPITSEENKKMIQAIGVEFVDEMSAMQELEATNALITFGMLAEGTEDDDVEWGRISSSGASKVVKAILGFTFQKGSALDLGSSAARFNQSSDDDYTSLQELFDDYTGTYSWNADAGEYEYEENSSDKIIFEFPAEEDGTSNNASLTFSNYEGVEISNPIEDYEGDMPVSLDVALVVDGSTSMSYSFDIDYDSEGVPEKVDTDMTMEGFALSVGLTNTTTKMAYSVSFTHDSKSIIASSSEIEGDFSESALEDAEDSEDPSEILTAGKFSFALLDLKFDAAFDFDSFWDELESLEEDDVEGFEAALNTYSDLSANYVSTGQKAADVEFYAFLENDGQEEWIEIGAKMIFEDESKVDVADFLEGGFDELEDAINDLIGQVNEDLDEEDWIEEVDFSDL